MKKSDIYEIALKLLGIYMLFHIIDHSYSLIEVAENVWELITGERRRISTYILLDLQNLIASGVIVFLLLFKSRWITRKICKPADYTELVNLFENRKAIYEVAFMIAGILNILITLPDFSIGIKSYLSKRYVYDDPGLNTDWKFIGAYIFKIVLSIFLIIIAGRIANYLGKTKPNEEETGVL